MRIAFIVDKCSPYFVGGYESRVLNIARRLSKRHDVRVVTSIDREVATLDGIKFVRSNLPSSRGVNKYSRNLLHSAAFGLDLFRNPFDEWKPEVLIIEAIPFVHLATARRWIRRTDSQVILNVNEAWYGYPYFGGVLSRPSRLAVRYLLRQGLDFADHVITISRATAESLRMNYGFADATVVPMGLDRSRLPEGDGIAFRLRSLDFVMVGRIVSIKRQIDLLTALARLKRLGAWAGRAAFIGGGPRLGQLKRDAAALGLSANTIFMGQVSEDDKFRILRDARAFVLCSEREGFSLATLEAQASGTPVVVAKPSGTDVFGVSDLVEDGITGLTYPLGNVEALSDTLARLIHDEELGFSLATNGLRQAMRYDWDHIVDGFEKLLVARLGT